MGGLLERDRELRQLLDAVAAADAGSGSVVLVSGEAGIGKTSLVQALVDDVGDGRRVLFGGCDDLRAPPSFAALRDAVHGRSTRLAEALDDVGAGEGDASTVFAAFLDELSDPLRTTVFVVEDAHWADDATLDALSYVGRRVAGHPAVLLVTYRDGELAPDHPLRRVLGALSGRHVTRIALDGLTRESVASLAVASDLSPGELMRITGGNPFFVTEMVAAATTLPRTVVDTVLARIASVPASARAALEQLSVIPSGAEPWLVDELVGGMDAIEPAAGMGLVQGRDGRIGFRHELARLAVLESLSDARRIQLHRAVARVLVRRDADPARVMHHAVAGADDELVLEYGPVAARAAVRSGAHRQALAQFEAVLPRATGLDPLERAALLEDYALEAMNVADVEAALQAQREACDLRLVQGDRRGAALNLRHQAPMQLWAGRPDRARQAAVRAIDILEAESPDEAAPAYGSLAQVEFRSGHVEECRQLAERSVGLARRSGDLDTLVGSLNTLGVALASQGSDDARARIEESLELARGAGMHRHVGRAFTNLVVVDMDGLDHPRAEATIADGLEYAQAHEMARAISALRSERVHLFVRTGRYPDAEDEARAALAEVLHPGTAAEIATFSAVCWLGRLQARRGDDAAADTLAEAQRIARHWDRSLDGLAPAAAALAELAHLQSRHRDIPEVVGDLYEQASDMGHPDAAAELGYWLWVAGAGGPLDLDHPLALQTRGEWRRAADWWEEVGCPYEQAMAVAEGDDPDAILAALSLLDGLGARAGARLVRLRLKELGVGTVPRGPSRATRANPAGLTPRQAEVFDLLARGLTNAQIADRLVLSVRTVDHHVSAILAKLGVSSREEAAARADALATDGAAPEIPAP